MPVVEIAARRRAASRRARAEAAARLKIFLRVCRENHSIAGKERSMQATPKKQRLCPTLQDSITASECASKRLSEIRCPAECPHNPFGYSNYTRFRELEGRWFDKAAKRAKAAAPRRFEFSCDGAELAAFREMAEVQYVMGTLLGSGPLSAGNPLERWAADPSASLSNDERLMTRFRARTRATVIEIQRKLEGNRCQAIDAMDPGTPPFVVFHPTLCKAPRFSRHLGWFTWFPEFVHPLGSMVELVPHIWLPWREEVLRELGNRQNMDCLMTSQRFLREHFIQAVQLVGALVKDWEEQREPVEKRIHYAGVYSVQAPVGEVQARFDSSKACVPFMVLPEHPTYGKCWGEYRFLVEGDPEELAAFDPYLGAENDAAHERTVGMFSLYQRVLLFHCNCEGAFTLGQEFLGRHLKGVLLFLREDHLDIARSLDQQDPTFAVEPLPFVFETVPPHRRGAALPDPADLPPEALRTLNGLQLLIKERHEQTFSEFMDEPHILLEDQTPREATRSAAGRARLIELMKITLYEMDVRRRQFQLDLDINSILRELGLEELIG
jgi:hypothetical protein